MNDHNDNRSRLDREIDEILSHSAAPIPITSRARFYRWKLRRHWEQIAPRLRLLDTFWGWLAVAAIIYAGGAWLTGSEGLVWQIVRLAGLIALALALYRVVRPPHRSQRKLWRGREIDLGKRGVELGDKFDEWRKRR